MNISYTKNGDYLLPNLILENKKQYNIGKYGLLRLNYIKKYKLGLYLDLWVILLSSQHWICTPVQNSFVGLLPNSILKFVGISMSKLKNCRIIWYNIIELKL